MWVVSIAYSHAFTTNNIAEYRGLVLGLRQTKAKASGYSPLHVGDSALVLSQFRTYRSPRKAHLALIYREARALADDLAVVSWGHHYRDYNKMAHCVANIAMDTCTSVQVHTPSGRSIVTDIAAFIDNDVNHWLETSMDEHSDLRGPARTATGRALSAQHLV